MKEKMFKPLLLSNDKFNLEDLDYTNMYISIKRDGVRAEITKEGIKNRSLKILRSNKIQEYFKPFYSQLSDGIIVEGEIYCDGVPCREMAGICNSNSRDIPEGTKLYIFGVYHPTRTFLERHLDLTANPKLFNFDNVVLVKQHKVNSAEEAMEFYNKALAEGYEGAVMMNGNSRYKCGRVTIREGIGFKLKPSREDDLEIIGVNERMENTNDSQTNELGRSYKRNTVDAKKPTGIAATFECKFNNTTTKVTITGTEESRREIWTNRDEYIGRYVICESMAYGTKDKPRHPRMLGIKESIEK